MARSEKKTRAAKKSKNAAPDTDTDTDQGKPKETFLLLLDLIQELLICMLVVRAEDELQVSPVAAALCVSPRHVAYAQGGQWWAVGGVGQLMPRRSLRHSLSKIPPALPFDPIL
jgi:hypothetical protein